MAEERLDGKFLLLADGGVGGQHRGDETTGSGQGCEAGQVKVGGNHHRSFLKVNCVKYIQ